MTSVIQLPPVSDSIARRFYSLDVGGVTLLERFLEWWRSRHTDCDLTVFSHSQKEAARLSPVVARYGGRLESRPAASELTVATEALAAARADAAVILPFGVIFLPDSFLARLQEHHLAAANDYTEAPAVPQNTSPCIVSERLVRFLRQIPATDEDFGLRAMIYKVRRAAAAMEGQAAQLPVRGTPFDFLGQYQVREADLPRALRIEMPDVDVTLAYLQRRLAARSDNEAVELLKHYKTELVLRLEARYAFTRHQAASKTRVRRPAQRDPRIRALFVAHRSAYSGAEESLVRMIEHFDAGRVASYALIGCSGTFADRLYASGARVRVTDWDFTEPRPTVVRFFEDLFSVIQPDIIHLNGPCGQAVLLAAARHATRVIQHLRSPQLEVLGAAVYQACRIVAVSNYLAGKVQAYDIDGSKLRVVYDGINIRHFCPQVFSRAEARQRVGIPSNSRLILMIGRLAPNKRHDVLFRSFRRVLDRIPDAWLALVGESFGDYGYRQELTGLTRDLGLWDRVLWLEFQPDIRWIECAADVQVLCSEEEPLGTCILESMALAIPVVISDAGGLKEVVEDGRTGYVIPAGHHDALAERCIQLLEQDELRAEMGRRARVAIEERYSARRCAEAMTRLYEEVMVECEPDSPVSCPLTAAVLGSSTRSPRAFCGEEGEMIGSSRE